MTENELRYEAERLGKSLCADAACFVRPAHYHVASPEDTPRVQRVLTCTGVVIWTDCASDIAFRQMRVQRRGAEQSVAADAANEPRNPSLT